MAQQTQIARVLERFDRWLARWPTAPALAAATPAEVLTEWVGLGYNRRALRLREACAIVARDGWPRDSAGLRALPGVGPYTAAAVASFAFGERVAAVDTNVRRVAARLGADPDALLPATRHADFNQAAMELGALVCTARAPRCGECPAAAWCPSRGRVTAAPRAAGATRPRFEETDRWARGRVVAALAAGERLPAPIAPERLERVLAGLERDGLIERDGTRVGLPGAPR
ncbi:MAG: A/G-specific adenine glycosylase [Solirubrobacteraceae bacterium]|nr:A/G-specific adenine glycosylase [Solirubrobacteraceae bacterium]